MKTHVPYPANLPFSRNMSPANVTYQNMGKSDLQSRDPCTEARITREPDRSDSSDLLTEARTVNGGKYRILNRKEGNKFSSDSVVEAS